MRITQRAIVAACLALAASCSSGSSPRDAERRFFASIAFSTQDEIDSGLASVFAFGAEDFTGDGLRDVLALSPSTKTVRLLVAQGAGAFSKTAGATLSFADEPTSLCVGDFDGDSDLDAAILFFDTGIVRILRNDGQGRLTVDPQQRNVGPVTMIASADLDADGLVDLVAARGDAVDLYYSKGTSFGVRVSLGVESGRKVEHVWTGDLDGDAIIDIAALDENGSEILLWFGTKNGFDPTRRQVVVTGARQAVAIAGGDLNADGRGDLAVADFAGTQIIVLLGRGIRNFERPHSLPVGAAPWSLAIGDVDGNTTEELVAGFIDEASVAVFTVHLQRGIEEQRRWLATHMPSQIAVVDVDRDGRKDLLCAAADGPKLTWLRGTPSGTAGIQSIAGGVTPEFLISDDVDGDGRADVIVSDRVSGVCRVSRADGKGGFESPFTVTVGTAPTKLSKGDYDGDGRVDFVVGMADGIRFLVNRSQPGNVLFELWPPNGPWGVGAGPFEVITARFDDDEVDDIAISDFGAGKVTVRFGVDDYFGWQPHSFSTNVEGGALGLVAADFDADDDVDLAVASFGGGFVRILSGDGLGSFTAVTDLPAGRAPNYLRTGDFDGDGRADLVVSDLASSSLVMFRSTLLGFERTSLLAGNGPTALIADDLNGDGLLDLLVANSASADISVLIGDGSGGFPTAFRLPGMPRAVSADLGDVDGDLARDILIAGLQRRRIGLLRNLSK